VREFLRRGLLAQLVKAAKHYRRVVGLRRDNGIARGYLAISLAALVGATRRWWRLTLAFREVIATSPSAS